jgi:hypothetical protein
MVTTNVRVVLFHTIQSHNRQTDEQTDIGLTQGRSNTFQRIAIGRKKNIYTTQKHKSYIKPNVTHAFICFRQRCRCNWAKNLSTRIYLHHEIFDLPKIQMTNMNNEKTKN